LAIGDASTGRIQVISATFSSDLILSSVQIVADLNSHSSAIWRLVSLYSNTKNGSFSVLLGSASADNTVKIWNTTDWSLVLTYTGHKADVYDVRMLDESTNLVASGSNDYTIHIWNAIPSLYNLSPQALRVITTDSPLRCLKYLPMPFGLLASGHMNGNIYLWNYMTGSKMFTLSSHTSQVNDFELMLNAFLTPLLASSSGDTSVIIWDLMTMSLLYKLTGHTAQVYGLSSLTNEFGDVLLASSSVDTTIKIWNITAVVVANVKNGSHNSSIYLLKTLSNHSSPIYRSLDILKLEQQQSLVISGGSFDASIKVWQVDSTTNNNNNTYNELLLTLPTSLKIRALVNIDNFDASDHNATDYINFMGKSFKKILKCL
jgi:WD40 repeat protein